MHAFINGQRDKHLEKLSSSMWELLFEASRHGGRAPYDMCRLSTRRALNGKGLLNGWALTDAGKRALLVEWRHPKTGEVSHCP